MTKRIFLGLIIFLIPAFLVVFIIFAEHTFGQRIDQRYSVTWRERFDNEAHFLEVRAKNFDEYSNVFIIGDVEKGYEIFVTKEYDEYAKIDSLFRTVGVVSVIE